MGQHSPSRKTEKMADCQLQVGVVKFDQPKGLGVDLVGPQLVEVVSLVVLVLVGEGEEEGTV